jgi:glycosyltransferase involved in cell wall biosynthesis
LVPIAERGVRSDANLSDATPLHVAACEQVFAEAHAFDILHFHLDYVHFPIVRHCRVPSLTTLHNRLDLPEQGPLFRQFQDCPVVSISMSHRKPAHFMNWVGNVYHGLPLDLYHLEESPQGYLAFLGRICPEKGVDRAIKIANQVGLPLKIASKVDKQQQNYLEQEIQPLMSLSQVEFVGEISDQQKQEFLGNATALLFPINWPEPFGLVMIEAMACGTPVIAFRNGSVDEVMQPGVTGFVCETIDEAVLGVKRIQELSRARCRRYFEEHFSVTRMAHDYLAIYQAQIASKTARSMIRDIQFDR